MQLKMAGRGKTKVRVELTGEDHTFANAIRQQLLEDDKVVTATYEKQHPQMGDPLLVVETDGEDPTQTLERAGQNLSTRLETLRKKADKALK